MKKLPPRAENLRRALAQEAARIMSEHGIRDFLTAKRKAAERFGVTDGNVLPRNTEIEDALAEYHRLFGGENSVGRQVRSGDIVLTVVGVIDGWQPTPRYYDLNAGNAFQDVDDVFVPLVLLDRNQERWTVSGNVNCWQAPPEEGLLHSECVMTQFWVELPDAAAVQDYKAFLDAYVNEQKKLGRFPRPLAST